MYSVLIVFGVVFVIWFSMFFGYSVCSFFSDRLFISMWLCVVVCVGSWVLMFMWIELNIGDWFCVFVMNIMLWLLWIMMCVVKLVVLCRFLIIGRLRLVSFSEFRYLKLSCSIVMLSL